ncbi:uncharacterized protein AB675_6474 [Cyphellophora attinorum]|uniref:PHD finger domain protein n=1 Tax=Cyphellophora attinorum TaxID=1664694 RepID=A0A0N0NQH5_9EURO|nr:uncharacterized protein AB675_6474 [Phialophora attinorum]KPI43709.1 hypothetical protein AB675_6474 [Phialophora attinorum]
MTDQRRRSIGHPPQRSLMGPPPPPETPSRIMQQPSPNLFPSLQFSPDIFAGSPYGPAAAPMYPQQRLFWDPSMGMEDSTSMAQYAEPFAVTQSDFSASFGSTATVVPPFAPSPILQQDQYYLPPTTTSMPPTYVDGSAFPAPFHTSPRAPPPREDNPSMFLSSPARRFGNDQNRGVKKRARGEEELQESRARAPSITRSVMEALRRPVSPVKAERPGLKRSLTHSGVNARGPHNRQQSHVSFLDSISNASGSSNRSRNGRASPLKSMLNVRQPPKRTSLSLAIDENGVATTVITKVDDHDDMDLDDESDASSVISSRDGADFQDLRSQPSSFYVDNNDFIQSSAQLSTVKASRMRPGTGSSSGPGDAAQAVRALIDDRARSGSGHGSSLDSGQSAQFNSSPPVPQGNFGHFNASPTTITDPDLATPSTDRGSQISHGSTRCVCGTSPEDPGLMLQWYVFSALSRPKVQH